jgi:hypothetical protein
LTIIDNKESDLLKQGIGLLRNKRYSKLKTKEYFSLLFSLDIFTINDLEKNRILLTQLYESIDEL